MRTALLATKIDAVAETVEPRWNLSVGRTGRHEPSWEKNIIYISHLFGERDGVRTHDPYIKSVMLYQLSYGIIILVLVVSKR